MVWKTPWILVEKKINKKYLKFYLGKKSTPRNSNYDLKGDDSLSTFDLKKGPVNIWI